MSESSTNITAFVPSFAQFILTIILGFATGIGFGCAYLVFKHFGLI